jgi:hypothetical protein
MKEQVAMRLRCSVLMLVLAVLSLFSINFYSIAQDTTDLPQITIAVTEDGMDIPAEIPEGIVTITFDNQMEFPVMPVPMRLLPDVTQEQLMETLETEGEEAAIELVSLLGGTMVEPGTTLDVTYDFAAGEYALFDFAVETSEPLWFTVADAEGEGFDETQLTADVEVSLVDFNFQMPDVISTEAASWLIRNDGAQWHEMAIMRVEDGMTEAEVLEMLMATMMSEEGMEVTEEADMNGAEATEEGMEATEEADMNGAEMTEEAPMGEGFPDFIWLPIDPEERAWVTVNLEPGTYAVVCFLPNIAEIEAGVEPHSHAELGMVQVITVE